LGIATEVTMRLVRKPQATSVALLYFLSWTDASEAVLEARRLGASAVEAMDYTFLAFVKQHRGDLRDLVPDKFVAGLLVEFEGDTDEEARTGLAAIEEWVAPRRGMVLDFRAARSAEERAALWSVRRAALPLVYRTSPVEKPMNFIDDTAVPVEKLGQYIEGLRGIFARHRTPYVIFGHAGNGNVHVTPLMDPHDATFVPRMAAMTEEAFELTWRPRRHDHRRARRRNPASALSAAPVSAFVRDDGGREASAGSRRRAESRRRDLRAGDLPGVASAIHDDVRADRHGLRRAGVPRHDRDVSRLRHLAATTAPSGPRPGESRTPRARRRRYCSSSCAALWTRRR
jgi:FAD/FMN-containing dehydrogenase